MHTCLRTGSHPTDAPDTLAMIAATVTLLGAALTMRVRYAVDTRLGYVPFYALGQPLGYLLLLLNLGDSLLRKVRNQGIAWKGRTYY